MCHHTNNDNPGTLVFYNAKDHAEIPMGPPKLGAKYTWVGKNCTDKQLAVSHMVQDGCIVSIIVE